MRVKHAASGGAPLVGHVAGGYLMRISALSGSVPEAVAKDSGTSDMLTSAAQAATPTRAVRRRRDAAG